MATSRCSYWCSKFLNLCGIFLAVGLLPQTLPGPPVALYESWPTSAQQRALLIKEYRFDQPLPVQYGTWIQRIVTGHWGNSRFHNRPVFTDVMQATGFTLLLLLWTGIACSLWMGLLWGSHRLLSWPGLPMRRGPPLFLLEAFPGFLIAVVLHDLAVWQLGWLGMANVSLWQPYAIFNPLYMLFPGTILAILPVLAWCTSTPPPRAHGQSRWQHTSGRWQHFCQQFRPLLAGFLLEVLLTEHVLTLPGLGSLGITALKRRDFPLLQGFLLCTGGLYWLLRLLVDRDTQAASTAQASPPPPAFLRRLTSNRQVIYSGIWGLLILLVLAALAAQLAPYSPTEIHSHDQLLRPGYRYLLGTDFLGRDILSRTLSGFRSTIPRVLFLTALTGGIAWLWLQLHRWFRGTLSPVWHSGAALIEAFPAFLLAWMTFLIVEPFAYPLEATLVFACLPSAGYLLSVQAPWSHQLVHLARLGERILVLDVLFFFLNLSPESLMPTWGSDIRHGMHYGHLNMWLVLAPTLAVVWSRYILYQLSRYDPALVPTTAAHRTLEVDRV